MDRSSTGREGAKSPAGAADPRAILVCAGAVLAGSVTSASLGLAYGALVFLACGVTWYLAPRVGAFALRHGATVVPGGRSVHDSPTPSLGGLAIGVPLLVGLAAAGDLKYLSLACGCALMLAVGAYDDLFRLSPSRKILLQVVAAVGLFAGGFRLPALCCPPFGELALGTFQLPLFVLWVLLVTNAINLIDGLDGLAAGVCLVASLACIALGYGHFVPVVLAGALLGFLRHNLPRASIFLGDAGSLMLGFALAALLADAPQGLSLPVAFGVLALPLGDLALAVLRRWLRGKPIFSADQGHVHHLLLRTWQGPGRVLAGLYAFAGIQALVAIQFPNVFGLAIEGALWVAFCAYLVRGARSRLLYLFRHRRQFKRAHVVRRYADEALGLVETPADVAPILEHVAEGLDLPRLRLGAIEIVRPNGAGSQLVAETLDCNDGTQASWAYCRDGSDEVFEEERRTIVCRLLRRAHAVLGRLTKGDGAGEPDAAGRNIPLQVSRTPRMDGWVPTALGAEGGAVERISRARVHFVACNAEELARLAPVVADCRARSALEPLIVHTGCRDVLHLEALPAELRAAVEPDLDLDVETQRDALQTAFAMDRYDALLQATRPELTVVLGDTSPALACALAAKKRGIPVAHLGGMGEQLEGAPPPTFNRFLAESIADLLVAEESGPLPASRRDADLGNHQLVLLRASARGDGNGVIRALEALIGGRHKL